MKEQKIHINCPFIVAKYVHYYKYYIVDLGGGELAEYEAVCVLIISLSWRMEPAKTRG